MDKRERYIQENDVLMSEWISRHGAKSGVKSFAKDGIISPEEWYALPEGEERILFLLKEAYDDVEHRVWDEARWIAHEPCMEECTRKDCQNCRASGYTFNPMAEWIHGIYSVGRGLDTQYDNWLGVSSHNMAKYYEVRDGLLRKAALMNIKKSDGARVSSDEDLFYYAALDKDLLRRQIELIEPTLIICGGTYGMLRCIYTELPKLEKSDNGCAMLGEVKVIATCHPNAKKKNEGKYKQVIENYRALKK